VTAHTGEQLTRFLSEGFDAYLPKPVIKKSLISTPERYA
jgi:CheY-like chemotaxis protein